MINKHLFLSFTLIFSLCAILEFGEIEINDADKLVLSPADLASMVLKEVMKKHPPRGWRKFSKKKYRSSTTTKLTTELSGDEARLKRRKVWSRWGKWGDCSVTCGGGVMIRQRVCLAGHCAPGEHEEQCRPCARSPCSHPPAISEDTHDLE